MTFQPLLRHRAVPVAALTAAYALYPKRSVVAEEPPQSIVAPHTRKPIYDSPASAAPSPADIHATTLSPEPVNPLPSQTTQEPSKAETAISKVLGQSTTPSPTARLAAQVKHARLFLHAQTVSLEDNVDAAMTKALNLESSFTSTLQSLAPPKESGERLLPGSVYVLVAAMAGSIVSRNRNILLRATLPFAVGLGTAYAVLPITTRNVGDLVWKYEERYPVLRDNHIRVRDGVTHFVQTGKAHSQMGYYMAVDKVQGVSEAVQEWVRKGK